MPEPTSPDNLTLDEIKDMWRAECKCEPPPISSRTFLLKALQFERQLTITGDISARDQKRLYAYRDDQTIGVPGSTHPAKPLKHTIKLTPGARLLRNWNGKTYTVSVIEEGFVYQDKV